MGAIKQFFPLSDDWSLSAGVSSASGPNPTGRDNRSEVYGADVYVKWRPITYQSHQMVWLQTEWFCRRRQVPETERHVLPDRVLAYPRSSPAPTVRIRSSRRR
jgi:hypothetical protein